MHFHSMWYELIYVLKGEGSFYVEGMVFPVSQGDMVLVRKGETHLLTPHAGMPYERMLVYFSLPEELDPQGLLQKAFYDRPLGTYNHYQAGLFPHNNWKFYLEKMDGCKTPIEQLYYLLPLLHEIAGCFTALKDAEAVPDMRYAASIIDYINQRLTQKLSLGQLAREFNMSKTNLNRIIKKYTGTTVWRYITVKRLYLSRERIRAGEPPTSVYLQCGYLDYTSFYRAYKQCFGVSPQQDSPLSLKQER